MTGNISMIELRLLLNKLTKIESCQELSPTTNDDPENI